MAYKTTVKIIRAPLVLKIFMFSGKKLTILQLGIINEMNYKLLSIQLGLLFYYQSMKFA